MYRDDELTYNLQINPYDRWGRSYPAESSPFRLFRDFVTWPIAHPVSYLAFEYLWPGRRLNPSVWTGIKSPRIPGVKLLKHFKFFNETPILNKVVNFLSGNYEYLGLKKPVAELVKKHVKDTEVVEQILSNIGKKLDEVKISEFVQTGVPRSRVGSRVRRYIYDVVQKYAAPHVEGLTTREFRGEILKTLKPVFLNLGRSATIGLLHTVSTFANIIGWGYLAYSVGKFIGSTALYSSRKMLYDLRRSFKLEFGSDVSDFLTAIPLSERQRAQRAFSEARMGTSYENYLGNEAAYLYR